MITITIVITLFKKGKNKKHFKGGRKHNLSQHLGQSQMQGPASQARCTVGALAASDAQSCTVSPAEPRRVPVSTPVPQHCHLGCSDRDWSVFMGIPHGKKGGWSCITPHAPSLHGGSWSIPSSLLLESLNN